MGMNRAGIGARFEIAAWVAAIVSRPESAAIATPPRTPGGAPGCPECQMEAPEEGAHHEDGQNDDCSPVADASAGRV